MASIIANIPPSVFVVPSRRSTLFSTLPKLPVSPIRGKPAKESKLERKSSAAGVVVKAAGESTESSTSLSIVKSVQNVWDSSEDRLGLIGLGFAAIVGIWASVNLVSAIDKLPIIPSVIELIGIFYSAWFVYRYLLFKPDREELFQIINKSVSEVLGQ